MRSNVKKEEQLLRVGVLGCGVICQAAHLIASSKARNIHLQAICDVAPDLREKMAAMYEPDSVYDDYDAMLRDPAVDAVIIGVGDQFHVPCARKAVLAGFILANRRQCRKDKCHYQDDQDCNLRFHYPTITATK